VLHAVDDMLIEDGYAAMTMKGIAERAGVGRQTVYRWWSTKAEILMEASEADARSELRSPEQSDPARELSSYLMLLRTFLATSPAGVAYRALVGEAQHDPAVRQLIERADLLTTSARPVLLRVQPFTKAMPAIELAAAQLAGPVLSQALTTPEPFTDDALRAHADTLASGWHARFGSHPEAM